MKALYKNEKEIYLAGGCFWGLEAYFKKIEGILDTEVGYANGKTSDTDYNKVAITDHSETLKLVYDSNTISLEEILLHFFRIIDPTSINKQGNDIGRQYRTGIYSIDEETKKRVQLSLNILQEEYNEKIAIENESLNNYVKAEDYHQDYLDKNPFGYCHIDLSILNKPLDESKKKDFSEKIKHLNKEEYEVTQNKGTEAPFSHKYDSLDEDGIYVDIVSNEPLFSSRDKFDRGCGWPSFTKSIKSDSLDYEFDDRYGLRRTEVVGKTSNSHLGHVFSDGPIESGGLRYCINGSSLRFIPLNKMKEEGFERYIPFVIKNYK